MRIPASLKSEIGYYRKLLDAGLDAAIVVRDGSIAPELTNAARNAWAPALVGAAIGFVGLRLVRKNKSGRDALVAGLLGAAVGFGGGVGLGLRGVTGKMLSGAAKNLGNVRDARWLEKNPITYA